MFCHKSLVPQCRTINSRSFNIVGSMHDFMWSVVAPLKCLVTTVLFLSFNSHPFTLLLLSPLKCGYWELFWRCFWLTGRFLFGCFWFWLSSECNVSRDHSMTCKSSLLFWLSSLVKPIIMNARTFLIVVFTKSFRELIIVIWC